MSTRSFIAKRDEKGIVTGIYCHWDGYPTGVGACLLENYKTKEKIDKLLKLGNISSIGSEPIDEPKLWDMDSPEYKDRMENDNRTCCITYAGRGETGQEARTFANKDNAVAYAEGSWCEYFYLFDEDDNEWYCEELNGMMTLEEAIGLYERRCGK